MPDYNLLIAAILMIAPLVALFINNFVKRETAKKFCLNLVMCVVVIQIVTAVFTMALLMSKQDHYLDFSLFWNLVESSDAAYFRVDLLSSVVIFSIGMVTLASLLTAKSTIGAKSLNFSNLLLTILLGMNGMVLVDDLFSLYVFLEITGISSFVLIALYKDKDGLEGAFKYLAMSAIASAFLLAALALIFMQTGSLKFNEVAEHLVNWRDNSNLELIIPAFVFFVGSISIKAGLVPFHGWLPDAYQSSPAAVSVLMGGIVTKAGGVYISIRVLTNVFVEVESLYIIFGMLSVASIVYGSIAAIGQKDFKRILAYSSISQIGYIILGAACNSSLGLIGAVLHFFNHSTFKTTLFLNATAIETRTGLKNIEEMGGLQEKMPVTGISSILAVLSAAGIPPLAGFWSKLLIVIAAWQAGHPVLASVALFASIFSLAYLLRLQRNVFFGKPTDSMSNVTEVKDSICVAQIFTSCITVITSFAIPVLLILLQAFDLL